MSAARIFLLVFIFTAASTCGKAQIPSDRQEMSQAANAFYRDY